VLLWIDRKYRPPLGQLMPMYVIGYGIGRFWVEGLRIDRADELAGLRWNQWVAIAAVVGGGLVLAFMRRHPVLESADPFHDREELVTDVLETDDELVGEPDDNVDVGLTGLESVDVDESDDATHDSD
jgi:hypothetical protein